MFSNSDSLATAVESAKEQDILPLAEESAERLGFDSRQMEEMKSYLREAWFFGVRTGYTVMVETKMGETDARPVLLSMEDEFQEVMERLGDALRTTVGATVAAWNYLGDAWIAGIRFWEVEIAARLIEHQAGGFGEVLRKLSDD